MTIVFFLDVYYCIIIAWTLFYLINSFVSLPGLPWESCGKNITYFVAVKHSKSNCSIHKKDVIQIVAESSNSTYIAVSKEVRYKQRRVLSV
jgi:SNF family Na+-dependent transporter